MTSTHVPLLVYVCAYDSNQNSTINVEDALLSFLGLLWSSACHGVEDLSLFVGCAQPLSGECVWRIVDNPDLTGYLFVQYFTSGLNTWKISVVDAPLLVCVCTHGVDHCSCQQLIS